MRNQDKKIHGILSKILNVGQAGNDKHSNYL